MYIHSVKLFYSGVNVKSCFYSTFLSNHHWRTWPTSKKWSKNVYKFLCSYMCIHFV